MYFVHFLFYFFIRRVVSKGAFFYNMIPALFAPCIFTFSTPAFPYTTFL